MKKYFSKLLQTFSGSLKAVRGVLKRLPHSLRSFAMTDFYLSGSLKNAVILNETKNPSYPHKDSSPVVQNDATTHSGSLKLVLALILMFCCNITFAQTPDFANPQNYKPGGKYRMFGAGRGTVEKVRNTIKPTASTSSKAGPLRLDAQSYAGYVHYEQRFSNHPLSEHGPFVNDRIMEVGDFHGSIINGQAGVAKAKITGREWHPADAYDAADGGDHPYDSYYYYVHGTVHSVSIQPIELPKLPSFSNPFSKNSQNNQNNGLPEKNAATENDRTRDLAGSGNLPNSPNGQPESSDVANNGEVPLPQALPQPQSSFWDGFAAGFTNGAVNAVSDFVNAVTHPADTVRNIGGAAATVATNPSVVSEAVVDAYDQKRAAIENAQNSFERGVESGSTTAAMATFFIPGGQAGKVQTAGAVLGKAAKTTDSVSDVAKAAKKAEKVGGAATDVVGTGLKYEPAPYHSKTGNNVKSPAPTNGQDVLNNSVPIGNNTSRRVGVDKTTGEYVVFDKHSDGTYHGHTRPWSGDKGTALTTQMKNALINAGLTNRKGKIQ